MTRSAWLKGTKASAYTSSGQFVLRAECIKEHNKKRVGKLSHPLMPVGRNSDAIAQAMKYMRQVVAEGCPFKHSDAGGVSDSHTVPLLLPSR